MPVFENFPYSNYHNINLDWILKTVAQLESDVSALDPDAAGSKFAELEEDISALASSITTNTTNIATKQNKFYNDYNNSEILTTVLGGENLSPYRDQLVSSYTIQQNLTAVKDALTELINAKQDALTFDTTPTAGSTNPVTSGGIYAAYAVTNAEITAADNITIERGQLHREGHIAVVSIYCNISSWSTNANICSIPSDFAPPVVIEGTGISASGETAARIIIETSGTISYSAQTAPTTLGFTICYYTRGTTT